jgi:septum site-determining protein MinD
MTRIISVISGKGGTGKTTLVSNLGAALASKGKKVLVIDGNVSGANLGLHLGVDDVYPVTLNEVLRKEAFITHAIYRHPAGFNIIPAALHDLDVNLKGLNKQVVHLLGSHDIILIDAAAGITDEVEAALKASDSALIVTNPEHPAVRNALNAKLLADKHKKQVLGIVLNKVFNEKHELTDKEIEEFVESPIIAKIGNHRKVREAIAHRTPLNLHAPGSKPAREVHKLACIVLGEEPPKDTFADTLRDIFDRS